LSIIHDALQKTQEKQTEINKNIFYKPKHLSSKFKWFLFSLMSFIAVGYMIYFFIAQYHHNKTLALNNQIQKNHLQKTHIPPLHLDGIFISNNVKLAMINNKFYRVGDDVNGLHVTQIEFEGVELEKSGNVIHLKHTV